MTLTITQSDTNLLDTSYWAVGSNGVTGFAPNESTGTENERLYSTDPFGNSAIVWRTHPSGDGNNDGGWNTEGINQFPIDPTKLYRHSVWVRRTSSTTGGTFYFGLYDDGNGVRRTDDSSVQGNPYWDCPNIGVFDQNVWYLVVAHVYPWDTNYTGVHPESGVYQIADGTTKVRDLQGCNTGGSVKWNSRSKLGRNRVYHFYCPDNTSSLDFIYPRVDVCDGNEPSIADLLANNVSTHKVVLPDSTTLVTDGQFKGSSLIKITHFRSSGVWNRQPNAKKALVKVVGGGGGAAGYCESGGAGGYAERMIDVSDIPQVTVTIGGGGSNVTYYAAAGDGGTSSFGSYVSATGGYGANRNNAHTGGVGGVGSNGIISGINLYGSTGTGHANDGGTGACGRGGYSALGGASGLNRASDVRLGYGAPGTGGPGGKTDGNHGGGVGESGAVIIWEYS